MNRKDEIVVQELDGEVLIYDLRNNKAFCLNETSALVWELCDGNRTIPQISAELTDKLNSPINDDLIWLAIDGLRKEKLIEKDSQIQQHLTGFSRRDAIKKVGLATMIALPIVATIVAPKATLAASCQSGASSSTGSGSCATPVASGTVCTSITCCTPPSAAVRSCSAGGGNWTVTCTCA